MASHDFNPKTGKARIFFPPSAAGQFNKTMPFASTSQGPTGLAR